MNTLSVELSRHTPSRTLLGIVITEHQEMTAKLAYQALMASSVQPNLRKIRITGPTTALFDDGPQQKYYVTLRGSIIIKLKESDNYLDYTPFED